MDHSELVVDFNSYEYANGEPSDTAIIKSNCTDFCVDEILGFEPTDDGDHFWLKLRKTDVTTSEVARKISAALSIRLGDIGYSGMKDKRGVCSQWFSVPSMGLDKANLASFEDDSLTILETRANSRKLKIGTHRENAFRINLRHFSGSLPEFEKRVLQVSRYGVPNYFGPQRFGRDGQNVLRALEYFAPTVRGVKRSKDAKRGLLLSALRSYIFNQVLSRRVKLANWNRIVAGEVLNLDGTKRFFKPQFYTQAESNMLDPVELQSLQDRLDTTDIHPTGILCGSLKKGDRYLASGEVESLEREVLQQFGEICALLVDKSITASRRPLRVVPRNLSFRLVEPQCVELKFTLARGGYATAVLRELCQFTAANQFELTAQSR